MFNFSNLTDKQVWRLYNRIFYKAREVMGGAFDAPTLRYVCPERYVALRETGREHNRRLRVRGG